MEYDIAIIGAGMAGLTAAIYAKRAGKSVSIFESNIAGGQIVDSLSISNWPGEIKISGTDLMQKVISQVKSLEIKTKYEEISRISPSNQNFTISTDENEYFAKTIIIATGTNPRKLSEKQTKDAGNRPISYCATCDGALYANKPVVIIGHGNTAKYEKLYLENIASKVYQIHHDDPIPSDAEAIFVAIGRVPNTGIFKNLVNIDKDGYIIADESCKTSTPGIFVAGDCRTKNVRQLVTAASDGAIAATEAVRYLE